MIVCPGCSNESADDAVFCGFCGTKLKDDAPKKTLFAFAAIPPKDLKKASPGEAQKEPAPKTIPQLGLGKTVDESGAADTLADFDPAMLAKAKASLPSGKSGVTTKPVLPGNKGAARAGKKAPQTAPDDISEDEAGWGLDHDFGDTSTGMAAITGPNPAVKAPAEAAAEKPGSVLTQETPAVDPAGVAAAAKDPASTAEPGPAATVPGAVGEAVLKSGVRPSANPAASVVADGAEVRDPRDPKHKATTVLPKGSGDILAAAKSSSSAPPPAKPAASASSASSAAPNKEDEIGFFGASLSQYGLVGMTKEELESGGAGYVSDQEVAAELKQANKRSLGMMLVAVGVFVLLIGAIAFLMLMGD